MQRAMTFPTLPSALERALAAQGYSEPTPVQSAVLEAEAGDRDLLVSAQTGSGKTVAFGLAMGPNLLMGAETLAFPVAPMALVIAPTRELAMQVSAELTWLYAPAGGRITTCVGGMDPRREQRALMAGVHIVVGTPGRLKDHLERGNLDLGSLRVVVLDEADEMLDMGFREDLEEILNSAPAERRTLMFSATIAREIATLARTYQRDAIRIDTTTRNQPHGDIEYRAMRVAPNELERAVVNVLRWFEAPGALVFCNTREGVRRLHAGLRERGFGVVALSGELSQSERSDALQSLRDGRARVCVATDVAARGLDLPDLGLVIHADLPVNKAGLLHRSGRTGRAGKKGISILLVPYTRRRKAEQLLTSASIEATWMSPPSADAIREQDQGRMLNDPTLMEPASEEDLALGRRLLETVSAEQIAAVLIRQHRARLPEPEELFDGGSDVQGATIGGRREASDYDQPDRAPRPDRLDPTQCVWFRLSVGRSKNADPKWLIPLICRLGHITKKDIGSIRIFDRETKFEISLEAEKKFAEAVKASTEVDVRIEPTTPPGNRETSSPRNAPGASDRGPRPPRSDAPFERRPRPERAPYQRDEHSTPAEAAPERPKYEDRQSDQTRPDQTRPDPSSPDRPKPAWKPRPAPADAPVTGSPERPKYQGHKPDSAKPAWKPRPAADASSESRPERTPYKREERAAPTDAPAERPKYQGHKPDSAKPAWKPRPTPEALAERTPYHAKPKRPFDRPRTDAPAPSDRPQRPDRPSKPYDPKDSYTAAPDRPTQGPKAHGPKAYAPKVAGDKHPDKPQWAKVKPKAKKKDNAGRTRGSSPFAKPKR
jgi:ATP-dependent RNA helicase DeaD